MTRAAARAWLLSRQPAPPASLAAKLGELVDSAPEAVLAGESFPAVMGALGLYTLRLRLSSLRTPAMDLLAADAFVTYAFEAASKEGTDVAGVAYQLLAQVGA